MSADDTALEEEEFADWLAKSHLPPNEQGAHVTMRRAVS